MTTEEKRRIAVILISLKIRITLENPNSEESKRIALIMEKRTGIPYQEIHRFHNAILNNNLENSFKESRAGEIAWNLCKGFLRHEKLNSNFRGQMSEFANEQKISFNKLLEVLRDLFHEIIDETLQPQSKA